MNQDIIIRDEDKMETRGDDFYPKYAYPHYSDCSFGLGDPSVEGEMIEDCDCDISPEVAACYFIKRKQYKEAIAILEEQRKKKDKADKELINDLTRLIRKLDKKIIKKESELREASRDYGIPYDEKTTKWHDKRREKLKKQLEDLKLEFQNTTKEFPQGI